MLIIRGWVRTEYARPYAPLSTDESTSKMCVHPEASFTYLYLILRIDLIETWRSTRDSGQWLNEEGQKVPC